MDFYDKVNGLCLQRGISITAMALDLGFSKGTPSNWKIMKTPPRAEKVKKVADYFGVSVEYLIGKEEEQKKPTADDGELNETESALLELFRTLPEESQRMYLEVLRATLKK
jgi:transcriptional regulator with XRE-family HTH domain